MSDLEVEKLVMFCRELRAHGLSVTPAEVVTATTALQIIDTADRDEVFLGLRSILTTSVDDFTIFEEVFKKFWNSSRSLSTSTAVRIQSHAPRQTSKGLAFFLENWGSSFSAGAQPIKVPGASDTESATAKDFSEFTNEELAEIDQHAQEGGINLWEKPSTDQRI